RIIIVGQWQKESFAAGFVAKAVDGTTSRNYVGTKFSIGENDWATCETFEPQLTSIFDHPSSGLGFKHTKLAPGNFLVYARRGEVTGAWKLVEVKPADQLTVDLTIDPARMGSVIVTVSEGEANW